MRFIFLFLILFFLSPVQLCRAAESPLLTAQWNTQETSPVLTIPQGRILLLFAAPVSVHYLGESVVSVRYQKRVAALFYAGLTQATGDYAVQRQGQKIATIRVVAPAWPEQILTLNLPKYASYEPDELRRIRRETRAIRSLFTLRSKLATDLTFVHPLTEAPQGGRFGARRVINDVPRRRHTGADYHATSGKAVRSMAMGKVVLADEHFFAGNSVFVDHGDGLISMYFHLKTIAVTQGQHVSKGQLVGMVGSTGRATGPHLHFGLRYRGKIVNPDEWLRLEALRVEK